MGYILVGGIPTPLKNMEVSWDYYSHHWQGDDSTIMQ